MVGQWLCSITHLLFDLGQDRDSTVYKNVTSQLIKWFNDDEVNWADLIPELRQLGLPCDYLIRLSVIRDPRNPTTKILKVNKTTSTLLQP